MLSNDFEARGFGEKGLCASGLNAIVADDDGFIWMSSEDGVNRFDGHTFIVLSTMKGILFLLLANKCEFIFKDKRGKYGLSLYGLSLYNKKLVAFTTL